MRLALVPGLPEDFAHLWRHTSLANSSANH